MLTAGGMGSRERMQEEGQPGHAQSIRTRLSGSEAMRAMRHQDARQQMVGALHHTDDVYWGRLTWVWQVSGR